LFILIALSWVYLRFGQVGPVAAVFWGLKPAVTALVLQAAWRMGTRTLHHHLLRALALAAFLALAVWELSFPWVVLIAAMCGWLGAHRWPAAFQPRGHGAAAAEVAAASRPQAWLDDHTPPPAHAGFSRQRLVRVVGVCAALWAAGMGLLWMQGGVQGTYAQMAGFFTQAALVTFGGAYAVLPFVVQGAVEQHGWLTTLQMMDGLALGETTPGPLIMVVAFVGFLGGWQKEVLGPEALFLAGVLGACVATFSTFLPSFLFILAGGPLVEATRGRLGFTAPLTAITAAVVGVIASLALFFSVHTFWPDGLQGRFDQAAALLAVAAAVALIRFKVGTVKVLLACALAGVVLRSVLGLVA
jgi:chromate transporter